LPIQNCDREKSSVTPVQHFEQYEPWVKPEFTPAKAEFCSVSVKTHGTFELGKPGKGDISRTLALTFEEKINVGILQRSNNERKKTIIRNNELRTWNRCV
jgi:hypothetical protein